MSQLKQTIAPQRCSAVTADKQAPRSPQAVNHDAAENRAEEAALDDLLRTDPTFYRTLSSEMVSLAARMKIPRSDLGDVVAEVWAEAVKYRYRFAGDKVDPQWRCWLMRVVRSKAVDHLRRLGHHLWEPLEEGEDEPIDHAETRRAEAAEWSEWLLVRLEKVREGNEETVRLLYTHFYQGRPIRELARESGMTAKSVECRIRRLLNRMREWMEDAYFGGNAMP